MQQFVNITRALSDANRVRALLALHGGDLCLCQIIELLKLSPSTVSKHMAILRQAGLVRMRKEGRWIYYNLPNGGAAPAVAAAVKLVKQCLADDALAKKDARALSKVRRMKPEKLCACYHRKEACG